MWWTIASNRVVHLLLSSVFFPLPSPASLFPSFLLLVVVVVLLFQNLLGAVGSMEHAQRQNRFVSPPLLLFFACSHLRSHDRRSSKKRGRKRQRDKTLSLSLWRANNNSRVESRPCARSRSRRRKQTEYREWEEERGGEGGRRENETWLRNLP